MFVRACDVAGNINGTTVTFIVDTVDPSITITAPVEGSYNNTGTVNVTWVATDVNGMDHYAYSTNGTTWTNTTALEQSFSFAAQLYPPVALDM